MGTILAFGDSNTYGWHEDGRLPREVRWPGALEALLPAGSRVLEEGLPGRTTVDGLPYFEQCIRSHAPLDVVVVFLGVNDLNAGMTPAEIADGVRRIAELAGAHGVPRVLAVAPHGLGPALAAVCGDVLDLEDAAFRADDPDHLGPEGHRLLAHAVAGRLALGEPAVRELRVVVTAEDYDEALRFYRDVLGLEQREAYASPDGRVTILEAGRATLELADPSQAAFIDRVEVGRRVAGHIRLAFEVADATATTGALADAGAGVIAGPTRTPWDSLNARLETPGGLQITLFEELE